jgi:UDP-3-O-[3-hydroxymyristoyl] N-acetylglucosamine deacetylase
MSQATHTTLEGIGLITGLAVTVWLEAMPEGSGIFFQVDDVVIPADVELAVNTERGVTLAKDGKVLSIVEHFLSACAMTGITDLCLHVQGAPELPLLDGSSKPWVNFLEASLKPAEASKRYSVSSVLEYSDPNHPEIKIKAEPSETLEITYHVNFSHPDLKETNLTWRETDATLVEAVAPARTFGMVSDLPKLQAMGLAKGVSLENTLGLYEDGRYTTPLRMSDEPIRHKMLDFIGDMMLCGFAIANVKGRFEIFHGGHTSHIAFGKLLKQSFHT